MLTISIIKFVLMLICLINSISENIRFYFLVRVTMQEEKRNKLAYRPNNINFIAPTCSLIMFIVAACSFAYTTILIEILLSVALSIFSAWRWRHRFIDIQVDSFSRR